MGNKIKAVIFDLDGTLVDSNDAHAESWVKVIENSGYYVSFEKMRSLIGMGSDKLLPAAIGVEKDSEEGQQIARERTVLFMNEYAPNLKPQPGVHKLLEKLRNQGYKLVIATSAEPEELERLLEATGVLEYFHEQTSSGEVKNSKPDPDVMKVALKKTGYPPEQVVMIGDTPYDVEASRKAGLTVIALRCGGWNDADLTGAIAIYNDPADLALNIEASILNQDA
jgi:HAD superfamily hydrolase (TIGR01509 family)